MAWDHFSEKELTCPCGCGRQEMNDVFMNRLVRVRKLCNFPFIVTSAFRCPDYNDSISSTGREGPHTTGRAVDIQVSGSKSHRILSIALTQRMLGIGLNQKGSHKKRFIHLDDLTDGPRPWVWTY